MAGRRKAFLGRIGRAKSQRGEQNKSTCMYVSGICAEWNFASFLWWINKNGKSISKIAFVCHKQANKQTNKQTKQIQLLKENYLKCAKRHNIAGDIYIISKTR